MENIKFSDWQKLDLRIGEITNVENIESADKLYKLTVDIGKDEPINLCAGIKEFYSKEDLINKKIVVFVNLEPKTLRGVESQGMILAAGSKEDNKCSLLTISELDIPNGTKIS